MKRFAAAASAVAALAAGCASYRPPTPLDDAERAELAATVEGLRAARVRVVVPPGDYGRNEVVDALDAVGFTAYRRVAAPSAADVELRASRRFDGDRMTVLDVWLPILTLGLWPFEIDHRFAYDLRFARADGATADASHRTEEPFMFGWLAIPKSWRDDWRWSVGRDESADEAAERERLGLAVVRRIGEMVRAPDAD